MKEKEEYLKRELKAFRRYGRKNLQKQTEWGVNYRRTLSLKRTTSGKARRRKREITRKRKKKAQQKTKH